MSSLLKTLTWLTAFGACALTCQQLSAQSKEAEPATRAANDAFVKSLPFSDRTDLAAVQQGRRYRFEFRRNTVSVPAAIQRARGKPLSAPAQLLMHVQAAASGRSSRMLRLALTSAGILTEGWRSLVRTRQIHLQCRGGNFSAGNVEETRWLLK
jgi:hypothetical protein